MGSFFPLPIPHSPHPISGNNLYRSSQRNQIEQLFYFVIFKRDASQRPIPDRSEQFPGPAAVNEDVSAESGVLRRLRFGADGVGNRLILGLRDQPLSRPFLGVRDVGIADPK